MNSMPSTHVKAENSDRLLRIEAVSSVAILMCTYNGEEYLGEQLDSIICQTHASWKIFISDDGSSDSTLDIIAQYKKAYPNKIVLFNGPRKGVAWNFWSLLLNESINADFYAFCDQDDKWLPSKLESSIREIKRFKLKPALHCGRTELVSSSGQHIGFSPLFRKPPGFNNALVQNIAGGNTMIVNHAGISIARRFEVDSSDIIMHDWALYLLVTASGGTVVYDQKPKILYRQHAHNVVGASNGLKSKLMRVLSMAQGKHSIWYSINCRVLVKNKDLIVPESFRSLDRFMLVKSEHGLKAVKMLLRSGLYRQTFFGNVTLMLAAWCGKL